MKKSLYIFLLLCSLGVSSVSAQNEDAIKRTDIVLNHRGMPTDLVGKTLHFSYSPSWKLTPLLLSFSKAESGNTYTLKGENGNYEVFYTPDTTANTALITIAGKQDEATIHMSFVSATCGTARMKWNKVDYYSLTFRMTENARGCNSLSRMGDPVGDVVPVSLAGKGLEINFNGAIEQKAENKQESQAGSMVLQFPATSDSFTTDDGVNVTYEPRSCGAVVTLRGEKLNAEVCLDFADSESGLAHVECYEENTTTQRKGATFRIRKSDGNNGYLQCSATRDTVAAPITLAGKLLVLNFNKAQDTSTERGEQPKAWKKCTSTPMMLQFPAGGSNTYSYQLYEQTPDNPWPPVQVTYVPEEGSIHITGNDMHVLVQLSFDSAEKGTANIEWHDEGGTWYVRGADLSVSPSKSTAGLVTEPKPEEQDGAIQTVDDGLGSLVRELELRTYKTAVERLYQKRLLIILPQIMEGAPIDTTISNANGTTALHNACGLSHVGIVRWLVDHGADLNAKTAKGASVDDCVGGPNAKAIRAILKEARKSK